MFVSFLKVYFKDLPILAQMQLAITVQLTLKLQKASKLKLQPTGTAKSHVKPCWQHITFPVLFPTSLPSKGWKTTFLSSLGGNEQFETGILRKAWDYSLSIWKGLQFQLCKLYILQCRRLNRNQSTRKQDCSQQNSHLYQWIHIKTLMLYVHKTFLNQCQSLFLVDFSISN